MGIKDSIMTEYNFLNSFPVSGLLTSHRSETASCKEWNISCAVSQLIGFELDQLTDWQRQFDFG